MIHIQMESVISLPYNMGRVIHGDISDYTGKWPYSCECGHNHMPGRVGVPTLL